MTRWKVLSQFLLWSFGLENALKEWNWSIDWSVLTGVLFARGTRSPMKFLRDHKHSMSCIIAKLSAYESNDFNFLQTFGCANIVQAFFKHFPSWLDSREKYFRLPIFMQIRFQIFSATAFLNLLSFLNHEKFSIYIQAKCFFLASNLERIATSNAHKLSKSWTQKCFWEGKRKRNFLRKFLPKLS